VTARQRRALEAICETFCPGARSAGVPDTLLELVPLSDRAGLLRLLALWDLPFLHGRRRRFSALAPPDREDVLRSWRDSRFTAKRRAFQGLRKGATIAYYGTVGVPGYPGPLGASEGRPRRIAPARPERLLDCDVCVVGSGAGGGVAAAVLAAAGLDVVVLEAGRHYEDLDFDGDELAAYRRLYLDAAALTTDDGGIGLLAGSCLGGTTMINYTTSFRTPDSVRAEWGGPFLSADYDRALDVVCARLNVGTDENRPSARDEAMGRGLQALGWHVDAMPRNVRGCDQGRVCGYCGFGCPLGAKQSTLLTWLDDAQRDGARILVETRAQQILTEGGAARGVEAVTASGEVVTVRARAVALACGALQTPVLLRRSGLGNEHVGRHLHLHPATGVLGVFAEEIRPWEGTMQALYSDRHSDLDGAGYGLKYETAPVHPGLLAAFSPWPVRDGARGIDGAPSQGGRHRTPAARSQRGRSASASRRLAARPLSARTEGCRTRAGRPRRRRPDPRSCRRGTDLLVSSTPRLVRARPLDARELRPCRRRRRVRPGPLRLLRLPSDGNGANGRFPCDVRVSSGWRALERPERRGG